MNSGSIKVVVLALLLSLPCAANASVAYGKLLEAADAVRSSDAGLFHRRLHELDRLAGQADRAQRQQLQYLHAYELITSSEGLDEGVRLAKELFENASTPTDLKFRSGTLVANSGAITRNFRDGLRYLERAMVLRHMVHDKDIRDDGTNVAAVLYNQLGQYALGLQYANETLADNPNPRQHCFAAHLRLESELNLGQLPRNNQLIQSAIDQCISNHELLVGNFLRATLARKMAADGNAKAASLMLLSHLPEVRATGYPRLIVEIESLLAELMISSGDIDGAGRHAAAAIENSAGLATTLPIVNAYKTQYDIAQRRGSPVQALAYYRRYAEANIAYLGDVKARELAYHLVRQETLQKNQQIELLNRQNNLLQLQRRVDQQKAQNSRLLMLFFAIFTLLIAFWGYKTKRMQMSVRRMAETDALTGICNRHHFTRQAEKTLAHSAKVGEQVSLIMFDLDHFKVINDTYGHVTGDWVLKAVAKTCGEICRRMDYFGRLGGEEFAILLQGCDVRAATRIADDCRVRMSRIESAPTGHAFKVTASFGVSCAMTSGYDLDKLISHADQMLYRAKREGRNRVKTYTHDVPIEMREPAPWHEVAPPADDPQLPAQFGALNA